MSSDSGTLMPVDKGKMFTTSCKQKLSTKGSVLVAEDIAMAQVLWTRHFLATQ